ncbi:MAG: DUF1540 domain-containing protein [Endomicrobiales bacterium]
MMLDPIEKVQVVTILQCSVTECNYNKGNQCHTPAITVGSPCPSCDTYTFNLGQGGDAGVIGGVGACRKSDCMYNQQLECHANGIMVGKHTNHADCQTYKQR